MLDTGDVPQQPDRRRRRRGSDGAPRQPREQMERQPSAAPTHADIARRAYDLYLARGGEHGHDLDDWLQAERELSGSTSDSP